MSPKPPSPPPAYTEQEEALGGQPSQSLNQPAAQYQYPQPPPPQPPQSLPQSPYTQGYYSYPQPQSPYSSYSPHPHPHAHHHAAYGPTPIMQQEVLLVPYFDPRSSFSLSEAAARARWRFLLAMTYALGILFVLGIATGAEIHVEER